MKASSRAVRADLSELERRRRARPLDFAKRLPWQEVAWSLVGGGPWRSEWGPPPSRPPREIGVILANRGGKTTFSGQVAAGHVTGRLARWQRPGRIWTGMPSLADSVSVQREHVAAWLGPDEVVSWRHRDIEREAVLKTRAGWTALNKSYDQGVDHWGSGKVQGVLLDEPPPDEIVSEARARIIDEGGYLLYTLTPMKGIQSDLHASLYQPFLERAEELKRTRPGTPCRLCGVPEHGALWLEVEPGAWIVTAGMRDNARSRGGFLPDEEVDAYEEKLLRLGRALEVRVRCHGEWLDVTEDRIVPVESLREWTTEPRGGLHGVTAWIDPAYSAKTASCESCIAVAAKDHQGHVYLVEYQHGRWSSDERNRICLEVLARHGDPTTHVQRVPGDREFAGHLNADLIRRSRRACVQLWPREGPVPDKVSRANQFAAMVAAGQVHVRPEHVALRRQAMVFSASYLRAGGECDVLDACMGALTECLAAPVWGDWLVEAMVGGCRRRSDDDPWGDEDKLSPEDDWRAPAWMVDPNGWD